MLDIAVFFELQLWNGAHNFSNTERRLLQYVWAFRTLLLRVHQSVIFRLPALPFQVAKCRRQSSAFLYRSSYLTGSSAMCRCWSLFHRKKYLWMQSSLVRKLPRKACPEVTEHVARWLWGILQWVFELCSKTQPIFATAIFGAYCRIRRLMLVVVAIVFLWYREIILHFSDWGDYDQMGPFCVFTHPHSLLISST